MDLEQYRLKTNLMGGGKSDAYRVPYTIQPGDTMRSVASKFNRNYNQIFWPSDNWETPLQPGQTVYVNYDPTEKGSIPTNLLDLTAPPKPAITPVIGSRAFEDNSTPAGRADANYFSRTGATGAVLPGQVTSSQSTNGSLAFPTTALQPGATGPQVKQLQDYLVSKGLMTQAQVNTGYGTYGPQTQAAVAKLQQSLGVDNSSGPGYFGPKTISALSASSGSSGQSSTLPGQVTSSGNTFAGVPTNVLENALTNLQNQGLVINPNKKEFTDADIAEFLSRAQNEVAPYYAEQLKIAKEGYLRSKGYNVATVLQNERDLETKYGRDLNTQSADFAEKGFAQSGIRQKAQRELATDYQGQIEKTQRALFQDEGNRALDFASKFGSANLPSQDYIPELSVAPGETTFRKDRQLPLYTIDSNVLNNIIGSQQKEQATGARDLAQFYENQARQRRTLPI